MSGKRHRYTVHQIQLFGDKATAVIGRELPLPAARKVLQQHVRAA